ncbi:hypothetical protein CERZMDRAFT_90590 [Cercospora zeae-maydis SCOH1-5]|uniref:Uncharacterized protein n=1 Tax=Cercospora zeae-maydis SCOH1-5 TaxID=717836 RepID=A0A6A6FIG1_9PEZI|nr:hypothetical protein CERZMDRAFT_90590 [Cercospora zeae-maydis SCOH1-5]
MTAGGVALLLECVLVLVELADDEARIPGGADAVAAAASDPVALFYIWQRERYAAKTSVAAAAAVVYGVALLWTTACVPRSDVSANRSLTL